ncbi:glycosyltransferase family 4 protein [Nocardia sp. NPDC049526]|uniref:glycosyltransferase family 4 protein n=1 Tax=Nocardia sp. NPDC049526 TaxID=3364316 RepID=UPI0037881E8D
MSAGLIAPNSAPIAASDLLSTDHVGERFRIAMVVPPYFDVPPKAYGGVEAVVADLVDALVARGHDVTLFGAGEPGTTAKFVPVWDRALPERLGEPFPEVVHALKVRRAIEEVAATSGLDLVHDHTFAGPLNAPAYMGLGLPTVVTVHGPVDEGDCYHYYRELGQEVSLVAISDRQRELAPDLNWVGRVHNALHVDQWPYQTEKGDYALFLGRFTATKGTHLALEAAHEAGIPLVLAGKCSEAPERAYFEKKVRPLITERDHLFGMADASAKRKLLAGARCLLFPIDWEEPFGMVMIEAMVCGTPVVALRGGAVAEVIVDGVTGRICDDPAELPAAIAEVSTYDPAACRAHVEANFGAGTLGRGYEQVYHQLLRSRRHARAALLLDKTVPVRIPASERV